MKKVSILVCLSALLFTGCPGGGSEPSIENKVKLTRPLIEYNDVLGQWITIESSVSWTITLEFENGVTPWASLTGTVSGSGSGLVKLANEANSDALERKVDIVVNFAAGEEKRVTLTQKADEGTPPVPTPKWLEMPEVVKPNENYYFVTHYAPLENGVMARNYSYLYDASTYTSYWIAYPMSKDYTGSAGRNDNVWPYDPSIPSSVQTSIAGGYGGTGNSRGHQVASNDRQASVAQNKQTFYSTNMTPQKSNFNSGIWGTLEGRIQRMIESTNDTLWCVTGAIIQTVTGAEAITYLTNNNDGKQLPYPNYYYKVIVRKSDSTYKGIGFWFNHFSATRQVMTIREIEALTGFNFYYNLSEADQTAAETAVDETFWRNLI